MSDQEDGRCLGCRWWSDDAPKVEESEEGYWGICCETGWGANIRPVGQSGQPRPDIVLRTRHDYGCIHFTEVK